jgi:hypothetical protein
VSCNSMHDLQLSAFASYSESTEHRLADSILAGSIPRCYLSIDDVFIWTLINTWESACVYLLLRVSQKSPDNRSTSLRI